MEQPRRRRIEPRASLTERAQVVVTTWLRSAPGGWGTVALLGVAVAGAGFSFLSTTPPNIGGAALEYLRSVRIGGTVGALAAVAAALRLDARGITRSGELDVARSFTRRAWVLGLLALVVTAVAAFANDSVGARRGTAFLVVIVGASALRGVIVALTRGGTVARTVVAESLVALATLPWVVDLFGDTPA
jgi:hypothetical protein